MKWDIAVDKMDRKRELKEQYKQMKADMGIIIVQNKSNNKYILVTSQNLGGMVNRLRFQLNFGGYTCIDLQKEWKELGEGGFNIKILEKLDYDKDESKTDYSEELGIMELMWTEKLTAENMVSYNK